MKKLHLMVIMALLCYTTNLFSQRTINITEQVNDINENPVFFAIQKNNLKASSEQIEKEFIKELYTANKDVEYVKLKEFKETDLSTARVYQQYYKGLKVIGGSCVVHSINGDVEYANGIYANLNLNINPSINEQQLYGFLQQAIKSTKNIDIKSEFQVDINIKEKELLICKDFFQATDKYNLSFKVYVSCNNPLIRSNFYIDAITGKLLSEESLVCTSNTIASAETVFSTTKNITTDSYSGQYRLRETRNGVSIETYNMNHGLEYNLPSVATDIIDNNTTWTTAEHPIEKYAHDAHWGAEKVFDYWLQVHGRNSLDNNGIAIKSYIQYGDNQSGGFWFEYPYPHVAYGEGNSCFKQGSTLDNVAHELGHGICHFTSNLYYGGNSGAINESFSDIWGAVIENWAAPNSPPKQKWRIGEEFTLVSPGYIRNMANPSGTNNPSCNIYPQPDTYNGPGYIPGNGVHINSGIMNYWFYLLTDGSGGNQTNDVGNIFNVTGIGITKSAKIAYETEKAPLSIYANFDEVRAVSIWKARKIYGNGCKGSTEEIAVTKAWYAVNVGADYNSNPPYTLDGDNSGCPNNQCNLYTLSGIPMINNNIDPSVIINWTLAQTPNNTVVGTNNGNGTYTICRNGNTNGYVTLTAQIIYGQCTTVVSKIIYEGLPYVLFPYQGTTYPVAQMFDPNTENCNTTCYSPSKYSFYSVSDHYNGSVTWQKLYSYPANVAWSGFNNYVKVLLKAPNQTITLKRIISNPCGSIEETYCFFAGNTVCTNLRPTNSPPVEQQLKVYPNPASGNSSLLLELSTDNKPLDFEDATIQLLNPQNVIILQKNGSKLIKEKIDIPSLTNGTYYIRVINKNGIKTEQIIISN